jgi:ferric-dicitrate binding protein FerR (iron transport regulator)
VLILISAFTTRHLIHTEDPVQMFSVQAPQGTNSRISLPDGSQVWLNAGSTLSYRSDFNRSSRDIGLSGEAYFEVARNADLPFRVQARGCTFTVLGTRFNISAYDEDPDVLAALMEGSLQFESSRSTETMVPGDLITYDCRTMEASRRQVDTDQFRSWIDGIIRYDAISLPALLRRLAREYDVKIELCTDAFDDKTFRISITEAQDIESIMGGLCDILPISVRRDTCGYRVDSRPRKTEP